ncbi:DUF3885 domain-containing protein [Hymenobacter endophyticus]|uniref:DUF3885 domain-containing protein n=1 Tax=Hymenobacter endophyticus TaxID=3076335 RepID=A0ABU3TJY2_9BACT|nr:DUF3885 domain-containing protein [Hymenobacter endophyticus]MDU0371686.1 DUF3885 domain-containing protein [Hymenobacter endophyticus]
MSSPLTQFFQQHATKPLDSRLLYYELPAWIRFDLQGSLAPDEAGYFAQVSHRAATLFTAAFAPTDEVLLVYQEHRYKRYRIRSKSYLFRQLDIYKQDVTFQKRWAIPNQLAYHEGRWTQAFYTTLAAQIPYQALLEAISYQDFPNQNKAAIHGPLYFFNQTTGLIFFMYDDRGILISSNTPETTRPLYQEYNDWILDYDRATIDTTFATTTSPTP